MELPQTNVQRPPAKVFAFLAPVLVVLASIYLLIGTFHLIAGPEPLDLRRRWIDQQYFFRGQNPFDVMFANVAEFNGMYHVPPWRNARVDPAIGVLYGGGYPPWSFISGSILVGGPWPAVRWIFAVFNLAAMGTIAAWAWRKGLPRGTAVAACLAAGSLAMMPMKVTLDYGQYGIIIMGLLVAAAWLDEMNWPAASGILLGISLLKPNISAPFFLCFLVTRRFCAVASCIGYVAVATVIASIVTKTGPLELLSQMQRSADTFANDMPNLIKLVSALHIPVHRAVQLVAAGGLGVGLVLLFTIRKSGLLWQFAVACVVARLWSYHRPYDDLMIAPLLVALGVLAARTPGNPINLALFVAVGLTVWLPLTFRVKWPIVALQHVAWIAGMAVVIASQFDSGAGKDGSDALNDPSPVPSGGAVA